MKKTIGFIFLLIIIVGMTSLLQEKDYNGLIIGNWISEGCSTCIWSFYEDGKIERFHKGSLYKTYTYTINSEKSVNEKFTIWYLKLVNIDDSDDIYEYDIIGLSKDTMRLDYTGDLNTKLTVFTKQ